MEMTTSSECASLGAAIASKLIIGFWFGIGVILAIRIVDSLNYYVEAFSSDK